MGHGIIGMNGWLVRTCIEHGARILQLLCGAIAEFEFEVLGERGWQDAPDTVGVELQGSTHLLHQSHHNTSIAKNQN